MSKQASGVPSKLATEILSQLTDAEVLFLGPSTPTARVAPLTEHAITPRLTSPLSEQLPMTASTGITSSRTPSEESEMSTPADPPYMQGSREVACATEAPSLLRESGNPPPEAHQPSASPTKPITSRSHTEDSQHPRTASYVGHLPSPTASIIPTVEESYILSQIPGKDNITHLQGIPLATPSQLPMNPALGKFAPNAAATPAVRVVAARAIDSTSPPIASAAAAPVDFMSSAGEVRDDTPALQGVGSPEGQLLVVAQLSAARRELEVAREKILRLMQQVVATQQARDDALTEADEQWELAEAALEHAVAARAEVEDAAEQLEGLHSEAAAARELANHTASELQRAHGAIMELLDDVGPAEGRSHPSSHQASAPSDAILPPPHSRHPRISRLSEAAAAVCSELALRERSHPDILHPSSSKDLMSEQENLDPLEYDTFAAGVADSWHPPGAQHGSVVLNAECSVPAQREPSNSGSRPAGKTVSNNMQLIHSLVTDIVTDLSWQTSPQEEDALTFGQACQASPELSLSLSGGGTDGSVPVRISLHAEMREALSRITRCSASVQPAKRSTALSRVLEFSTGTGGESDQRQTAVSRQHDRQASTVGGDGGAEGGSQSAGDDGSEVLTWEVALGRERRLSSKYAANGELAAAKEEMKRALEQLRACASEMGVQLPHDR